MRRLIFFLFLFQMVVSNTYAKSDIKSTLSLKCSVLVSNYSGVEQASHFADVVLTVSKNLPGGNVRVTRMQGFEFWVMTHGLQRTNNQVVFNSFQVAIKSIKSGLFIHALSDVSFDVSKPPQQARISLVDYHPDSFIESGELLFECLNSVTSI